MSKGAEAISPSERIHYLDALRALVMSIGILLHASLIAGVNHWFPQAISTFSHLFRMKLFIILGGFFIALQVGKVGAAVVRNDRIRRLGVPILLFLLFINPVTIYIWNLQEYNYPEFYYYTINMPRNVLDTHGAGWHLHIWFLIVLLSYCLIIPVVFFCLESDIVKRVIFNLKSTSNSNLLLIIAVSTSVMFVLFRALHFFTFQNLTHGGPLNYVAQAILTYFPFFVLGICMQRHKSVFNAMHTVSLSQFGLSFVFLGMVWVNIGNITSVVGFAGSQAIQHFAQEFAGFYICCILLVVFSRFANNRSDLARFLSDSSYTVYLFHVPVLVCAAAIIKLSNISNFALYLLIMPVAYIACLVIHRYFVDNSDLRGFLFNGRPFMSR